MAFVEIMPSSKQISGLGTGVRISVTERLGVRVSLAGDALLTILAGRSGASADAASGARSGAGADAGGGGGDATARFRVLVDRDPAMPRLRIVADPSGPFTLGKPPIGDRWRFVTVGKESGLPAATLPSLDCTWESVDGKAAIDIDLPREMRITQLHQPVGQPSTSTGPRPAAVTLPGGRSGSTASALAPERSTKARV